jgi:hypothetical protein
MEVVGKCEGNYVKAAKRLSTTRQNVAKTFQVGCKKLGIEAAKRFKTRKQAIPTDNRGQATI